MKSQDVSYPHTTHCLPNGEVMISTMGDKNGKAKGSFICFDAETFEQRGMLPEVFKNKVILKLKFSNL